MGTRLSRRSLLAAGAAAAPIPAVGAQGTKKSRRPAAIKLGMQGSMAEHMLRFIKQIGVEWFATSLRASQGQTISEALSKDVVVKAVDGSMGGIGGPPGGPSGPWKEEEVAGVIRTV